ncbi:glycosyltransferase [Megasphaera paucivorans]|uniref:Glycosyltransferase involved in cell wall bisynthesis n=1 Tax=Megasphaera paucivorans TaxID=349095 RepID=A0A1G9PW69_9FIRM|nr:glycosyltransferase [Megasphaera paucivorans]SDM02721.1 Glycosyltransferase involved in cell wall bisynthesis [Megasphaera paucivorans]
MDKIRILQVGMTDNIGGMETYLMEQYRHLDHSKITYDFVNITADQSIVFEKEIRHNGNFIFNICRRSKNPLKHYYQWWKLLKKERKNYTAIVLNVCHLYYVFPLFIGKIMGIHRRIIHSHNNGDEVSMGIMRNFLVWINRKIMFYSATDFWACSKVAGKWMFKNKEFIIIHNAICTDSFAFNEAIRKKKRRELGLDNKFVIGHVGRFSYQKNHEFLIRVFYELRKKKNNACLLLVGGAAENDYYFLNIKKMVDKLELNDYVYFLGMRNDVNELMQAMDCFVFPSYFEGFAIVGIEAQTAGLPCFFSENIIKEVAITNLVHFCNLSDVQKWIELILKYTIIQRINMKSAVVSAGYDIENEVKKIEQLYLKTSR